MTKTNAAIAAGIIRKVVAADGGYTGKGLSEIIWRKGKPSTNRYVGIYVLDIRDTNETLSAIDAALVEAGLQPNARYCHPYIRVSVVNNNKIYS